MSFTERVVSRKFSFVDVTIALTPICLKLRTRIRQRQFLGKHGNTKQNFTNFVDKDRLQ